MLHSSQTANHRELFTVPTPRVGPPCEGPPCTPEWEVRSWRRRDTFIMIEHRGTVFDAKYEIPVEPPIATPNRSFEEALARSTPLL